jgi:mxaJ protein
MSSRFRRLLLPTVVAVFICTCAFAQPQDLRVCADPNNMPFSNSKQQGFENAIAQLVAKSLGENLVYVWQRMGRGFVREYINAGKCDLLIGVPSNFRPVLTTTPYYRSTYYFVSRRDRKLQFASFDAPELRGLKVGVQVLEEEYAPPGQALARRGLQGEIVGFDTAGDTADSIVRAVADKQIDLAVVWGPLAGYFGREYKDSLKLTPVDIAIDPPALPFAFSISMGVRKGNAGLHDAIENVLREQKSAIQATLNSYGIPQLPMDASAASIAGN